MAESESEDEILDRIEEALRKIAGVSKNIKLPGGQDEALDRKALSAALDKVIFRLREALDPPQVPPTE
ncbi:MAG: hypothetical protein KGL20_00595 [Rhodospirillales bacterium]|nr:hypothetical protein [Rhodospirillales bacterium]MDE2457717.1 hypothetical protein [Rhodospirillales bacterium]